MSIIVLCPSRERPQAVREAGASLIQTRRLGETHFLPVVDHDDPLAGRYMNDKLYSAMQVRHSGGMVAALNTAVGMALESHGATIIGFIGDDHRFRTDGWDQQIEEALRTPGIAYGNDLFMGERLPTQVFISREIVEALGYYALPDCHHLYVDDAWRSLADELGIRHYLPEVIIEHLHPLAGKAQWDEGYKRVNAPETYSRDEQAFRVWREGPRFAEDVRRVRQALA